MLATARPLIVPVVWILQTKPDYRDLRSSGIPDLLAVLCVPYLWVWMTPEIWRSLRRQRAAESARRNQMWSLDQAA